MIRKLHSAGSSVILATLVEILPELPLSGKAQEEVSRAYVGTKICIKNKLTETASGCFHLHSEEPLFHQLIAMSGTSLLRARRPELLERSFGKVVDIFGWNNLSPAEQVQKLLDLPMEELRAKVGRQIPIGPMVDGDVIPEITTFHALANDAEAKRLFPGITHCKKIVMGDCQMDVSQAHGYVAP